MAVAMKCAKFLGTLSNFTVKRSFFLSPLSVQAMKHDSDYKISNGSKAKHEMANVSYCQMLRQRREEAEKSVIVQFSWGTKVQDIIRSMELNGGKIRNIIFYKVQNQGYFLFEFENRKALQKFRQARIDLYHVLQFHNPRSQMYHGPMPAYVTRDKLMHVPFDSNCLDTAESLSDQIGLLHEYQEMRPQQKRCQFFVCHQVEEVVRRIYPEAVVLPFGSGATGFGLANGSDLDMVMLVDGPKQRYFNENLSYVVSRNQENPVVYLQHGGSLLSVSAGIKDVSFILRARVPIVSFKHIYTGLNCDLSCNQRSGLIMAQIQYAMAQYDKRFHPLVTVIKIWGKARRITGKGPGSSLSNFMLNMLMVHFLQTRDQPVLPAIKDMYKTDVDEEEILRLSTSLSSSFLKDVSDLPSSQNEQSMGDLLTEFFQYFAEFEFSKYTIDLNKGTCEEIGGYDCMRIENPCEEGHNICRNVKPDYLAGFQYECRSALKRLESNMVRQGTSPWGLSYVINPELHQEINESLHTSIDIESVYEELKVPEVEINEVTR